jgi:hypothetical protein
MHINLLPVYEYCKDYLKNSLHAAKKSPLQSLFNNKKSSWFCSQTEIRKSCGEVNAELVKEVV